MDNTQLQNARREAAELRSEVAMLKAQIAGNSGYVQSWLQRKVDAQRKALRVLNLRVVNQRVVLRTLDELGRGLTREEVEAAHGVADAAAAA